MKSLRNALVLGIVMFAGFAQAASDKVAVEGVVEVPVAAGTAELTAYSKIAGGVTLTLDATGVQTLRLKCHQGIKGVSLYVFMRGNIMSEQLESKVENMQSCVEQLNKIASEVHDGANALRVEVRTDHTLGLSTLTH
ncbi:hypothetical protein [Bdellovibrio sp. HCB209]|uniref:hypothetical protein n=1 Tax=Bdellovibrio sp. HCB209 TaxID=3394354 RepID=UPI0039B58C4B